MEKDLNSKQQTKVSFKDLKEGVKDEYGVIYSPDGKGMLGCEQKLELEEYTIKDGTEVICSVAFDSIVGLKRVKIPKSVKTIGEFAFYKSLNLEEITIPGTVEHIGRSTFARCESLKKVILEEGIKTIEKDMFAECVSLSEDSFGSLLGTAGGIL